MLSTPKAKGELFLASSLCDGLEDNDIKQVTTLLLNKDADPNVLIPSHGVTPFHLVIGNDSEAFAEEVTKLFLRHGGDPNVRSADGLTPVHVAAAWGRTNVLEILLEAGGDPSRLDDEGRSPFHYAFDGKFYKAVSILGSYRGRKNPNRDERTDKSTTDGGKDSSITDYEDAEESLPSTEFFGASIVKSSPKTDDSKDARDSQEHRSSLDASIDIARLKKMNERNEGETEEEKWLVNRIIDQLSTSLTSRRRKTENRSDRTLTSPTTNEEPSVCSEDEQFYAKTGPPKKCFGTPKYRRKVFSQRTRSPCASRVQRIKKPLDRVSQLYNPEDSIISKSPNLLLPVRDNPKDSTPQDSKYYTPRLKYEDLHPRERNIGRDVARSTPRRRRHYRNSSRKVRNSGHETNSLSSPETSFSSENAQPRDRLRVKLHESKYDQDADLPPDLLADFANANVKICEDRAKNLSIQSLVSVQEEYKYEDHERGVALLERRLYVLPNCESIENIACESTRSSYSEMITSLPDKTLRQRLMSLGEEPGPITNTTRYVYRKRLVKLEQKDTVDRSVTQSPEKKIEQFLEYGDWVNRLDKYKILERESFMEFVSPTPSKRWREGNNKTSFNYLLLDSRVTKDLPYRSASLSPEQTWSTFVSAIFYVGKGKRARPYAHLYDAFNAWVSKEESPANKKIGRILEIWNAGYGVICLHVFLNTIAVEAFTREAAMIHALGIENLANARAGEYYGAAARWTLKEKRCFGRYLLHKAMHILLQEGERQLFPENL